MSRLPVEPVIPHDDDRPFWEAAAEGRLVLPRCVSCRTYVWYPREFCPACGSLDVEWLEATGRGTVYACTVVTRGVGAWAEAAPFVIAYVELEEGPRVLTNVIDVDPARAVVGLAVTAVWDRSDGGQLLRFRPA